MTIADNSLSLQNNNIHYPSMADKTKTTAFQPKINNGARLSQEEYREYVQYKIDHMTVEEAKRMLIAAGILHKNGKVNKIYYPD